MNNIGCYIHAGLGNQLFQIFACISYYLDNNCQNYILCCNKYNGYRKYYWDTLFSNISHNCMVLNELTNYEKYTEPFHPYKQIPIFNNDTLLEGYFQCSKYFEHNIDKIKTIIGIDKKINNVLIKYPEYTINKTITIHYRMGDAPERLIKKPSYYIDAFNALISKGVDIYDYDILYFCEEENNERVNNFNLEINNVLKKSTGKDLKYKKVSDAIQDWEQLLIMTSSKHYIIGNSTFSWFGAYLSSSSEPIICYPISWYLDDLDSSNLFPDSWIAIDDK